MDAQAMAWLCGAVAHQLERTERLPALVLCWLALVHRDRFVFSALARDAALDEESSAVVDELCQKVADGEILSSERLVDAIGQKPLRLLALCDRLVDELPVGQVDGHVTARQLTGVSCVETAPLFALADIGGWLKDRMSVVERVFVCPRTRSHEKAPVEAQSVDPDRWTPGWSLIADPPDLSSPSFRIDVKGAADKRARALEQLQSGRTLKVYLAEFRTAPSFESWWSDGNQARAWRANGLLNEAAVRDEALAHLAAALAAEASVIVLPELSLTVDVREAVKEWLFRNVRSVLPLVIAGSFHVKRQRNGKRPAIGDYGFVNEACVVDGMGETVDELCHWKMRPVELADGDSRLYEAIDLGCELRLYHNALGLHATVICKDLAEAAEMGTLPLTSLPLRFLWVPSLCASVSAHCKAAERLVLQRDVVIACANQGQALLDGKPSINGAAGASFVMANVERRRGRLEPLAQQVRDGSQLFDLLARRLPGF